MRVIVTGSAGRLGRSVAAGLAASGHQVIGADRVVAGLDGVEERTVDLIDALATRTLLDEVRPDAVVHLAGIAVPFSAPERRILMTNTALVHTVLAAAVDAGVERVLAASSPTVLGYSSPDWRAERVPLDETTPAQPANAYALSKLVIEETVRMFARTPPGAFGFFRPCYVISPEEWAGAPTQQGHTLEQRLLDPSLAAVSLFNYLDARDAAAFVGAWLAAPAAVVDGEGFFVGAADALAVQPIAALWREFAPALGEAADSLGDGRPVFAVEKAERLLGWRPERGWRTELEPTALEHVLAASGTRLDAGALGGGAHDADRLEADPLEADPVDADRRESDRLETRAR
ncbi:NAD-dependent epimerase/dehydratase family protein [Agromyces salentinus]|uniref:NAD(P)-dependent oxidoreductase n=1 Tax=Agromyces salentinus TaxID=269421 RepID=A0ABP4YLH5_9MICO|nr:NAD(P)-dependent oxidoreductase [Agromyces salentinus]